MNKKLIAPRVMIAATNSGAGKTTLVCGLLKALKNRGMNISAFKCGPDYIDPSFYREIIGTSCTNVDLFFQNRNSMLNIMKPYTSCSDMSVIEGVMGYYDGIGGKSAEASAYDVARNTQTSVILVVDAKGASLSLAAMVKGFKDFKEDSNIAGVILNRCTKMQYMLVKEAIEDLNKVKVLGYLPKNSEYSFESRHLGLINAFEIQDIHKKLDILAKQVEETIEIDEIIDLANTANDLDYEEVLIEKITEANPLIAIAKDRAFSFYYEENIRLLEKLGGQVKYFSPIEDAHLPEGTSAIYIGGGYPELNLDKLSANISMKESIRTAHEAGMPMIAECGGFMYLTKSIENHDMVGIIAGKSSNMKKLSRFGYIEIEALEDNLLCKAGEKIKAHEFHYFDTSSNGKSFIARKPSSQRNWTCVHADKNLYAGYPHIYFYSNIKFAENFVRKAVEYKER